MTRRRRAPVKTETDLLVRSRRRCCLCFGLQGDLTEKHGQIAHLDGDPSNNEASNLAFLCFDHHSQYDSSSRMGKGFTSSELIHHRTQLYAALKNGVHLRRGLESPILQTSADDKIMFETVRHHAVAWYNEVVETIGKIAKAQDRAEFNRLVFEYSHSRKHLPILLGIHKVLSARGRMEELAKDIDRFLHSLTGGYAQNGFLAFP